MQHARLPQNFYSLTWARVHLYHITLNSDFKNSMEYLCPCVMYNEIKNAIESVHHSLFYKTKKGA